MYRSASIERKQWVIGLRGAGAGFHVSQVVDDLLPKARAVWNEPILGEFCLSDHEQFTFEIDIFIAEPRDFTDT